MGYPEADYQLHSERSQRLKYQQLGVGVAVETDVGVAVETDIDTSTLDACCEEYRYFNNREANERVQRARISQLQRIIRFGIAERFRTGGC